MRFNSGLYFLLIILVSACSTGNASDPAVKVSQWRGPDRNGIYPEKNLLKIWPEDGPELLWSYEGLGDGHGSVSFGKDKIFVLGMPDSTGLLYAFDLKGRLIWKKEYGPEWNVNYVGTRSTPTIVDHRIYFESGRGVVYCYDSESGKKIWEVDLLNKFGAQNVEWGKAESLLIDGERLICTPGGFENNVVALNRFTGETIWTSSGNKEPAAYNSPVLIEHNGTRLIVTLTSASIIGLDAETGQFYWQAPLTMEYKNNANTPVYSNGYIYATGDESKSTSGLLCLELSADGKSVTEKWRNQEFTSLMGGFIVKDQTFYGSRIDKRSWYCIDANTGEVSNILKGLHHGVIISADDLYYCYGEDGTLSLAEAAPSSFRVISSFKIKHGTGQHWAHPVINNGILYIRHGNALLAYNLKN